MSLTTGGRNVSQSQFWKLREFSLWGSSYIKKWKYLGLKIRIQSYSGACETAQSLTPSPKYYLESIFEQDSLHFTQWSWRSIVTLWDEIEQVRKGIVPVGLMICTWSPGICRSRLYESEGLGVCVLRSLGIFMNTRICGSNVRHKNCTKVRRGNMCYEHQLSLVYNLVVPKEENYYMNIFYMWGKINSKLTHLCHFELLLKISRTYKQATKNSSYRVRDVGCMWKGLCQKNNVKLYLEK